LLLGSAKLALAALLPPSPPLLSLSIDTCRGAGRGLSARMRSTSSCFLYLRGFLMSRSRTSSYRRESVIPDRTWVLNSSDIGSPKRNVMPHLTPLEIKYSLGKESDATEELCVSGVACAEEAHRLRPGDYNTIVDNSSFRPTMFPQFIMTDKQADWFCFSAKFAKIRKSDML